MNCKKVFFRLHAYVDGEMPAELMREMDEHLGACPACRDQVERIRQARDILDSLSIPPVPQGFSDRVMAEAKRRAPDLKERKSLLPVQRQSFRWLFGDLSVPMRLAACGMVLLACLLGMFMSKELSISGNQAASVAEAENLDGFEWFSPTPPSSLGSAYLTLTLATPQNQEAR